jgi:hypothetical protein
LFTSGGCESLGDGANDKDPPLSLDELAELAIIQSVAEVERSLDDDVGADVSDGGVGDLDLLAAQECSQ